MSTLIEPLYPKNVFPVEHRLDGGPGGDGEGWGRFEYTPASNVPPIDLLTWAVIIHTAETFWLPGYGGGVHPHLDYQPHPAYRMVQRVRRDRRAGTLRGPSTVENGRQVPTNRARVRQMEINAYSAWWIAAQDRRRLAVRDLDDTDCEIIAAWIKWEWENSDPVGPLVWYPKPLPNTTHPMKHALWVPSDGQRSFFAADHATAPDDSPHWDSDNIVRAKIMNLAGGVLIPFPEEEDMLKQGDRGKDVADMQTVLRKRVDPNLVVDGDYGEKTAAAVRRFQAAKSLDETGGLSLITATRLYKGNNPVPPGGAVS